MYFCGLMVTMPVLCARDQAGDATALLLVGIARHIERDYAGAIQAYTAVLAQGCESGGRDVYALYLLSQMRKEQIPEAIKLPEPHLKESVCENYQVCTIFYTRVVPWGRGKHMHAC